MKIFYLALILPFLFTSCKKKEDFYTCEFVDYRYYYDQKIPLGKLSNEFIVVGVDTNVSDEAIQSFIGNATELDQSYKYTIRHYGPRYKFKEVPLKLVVPQRCEEITRIIRNFERDNRVSYVHYTAETDKCNNYNGEPLGNKCVMTYWSSFQVKVFDTADLSGLLKIVAETNTELVGNTLLMKEWFEIRTSKASKGGSLKLANYFQESGSVKLSDASFYTVPVE